MLKKKRKKKDIKTPFLNLCVYAKQKKVTRPATERIIIL